VFSRRDLGLLEIVALQAAALLENQRMSWALQMSAKVRETTLEAVSDGILSVAMDGTIRQANGVAARLLGRAADAMEGQNFWDLPALSEQRAAAPDLEGLEGKLLRLPGGEVVVSARVIKDDAGIPAGVLLALTGLRRAQRAAQRILGARARYTEADILGDDPTFREQVRRALSAASSDASILITGESGTGKEVLAQAVHNASPRAAGPFVGINCAAIPRDLLESELFGHEEGAFTGSRKGGQPGKFELAEGGTLLLDEIGDMPPEMQVKLLRVLQERRFQRVGGSREHVVDVRIIATTNRDLEVLAQQQRFRTDLLFRLKVIHAHLPALRERRGDIAVLVEVFLKGLSERAGKHLKRVAPVVMDAFLDYGWPGNIRELQSILEGEVSRAGAEVEELAVVPEELGVTRRRRRETLLSLPTVMEVPLADVVANAEKDRLVAVLTEQRGDVLEVARMLGVSRATVYNRLREFGLDTREFRASFGRRRRNSFKGE
jgi:transcriptional regulator with PAS, ATPase and Fis domain